MRPFHIQLGSGGLILPTRPGRSPRPLRAVLRLLCVAGLLAWQLAVAAPAHANPGDLDLSFGTGGKVIATDLPGPAFALVVQADGKLVAAGFANPGAVVALARHLAE